MHMLQSVENSDQKAPWKRQHTFEPFLPHSPTYSLRFAVASREKHCLPFSQLYS